MEFGALLDQICHRHGWAMRKEAEEYRIIVPLPKGRKQEVHIRFMHESRNDTHWAKYISVAGPAHRFDPILCLALNASDSLVTGAAAKSGDDLVFVDTQMLDDADESEVEMSIRYVAEAADSFEKLVSDQDTN